MNQALRKIILLDSNLTYRKFDADKTNKYKKED
jgi:hypothetical protein